MINSKKKFIVLLAIIILQAIISFLIITFVFVPENNKEKVEGEKEEQDEESSKIDLATIGEVYLIEDIVINPAGTRGRRFISLSIGFELSSDGDPEDLKKREPKIVDLILFQLSKKGLHEFINIANREILRQEILETVKEVIPKDLVKQVYITKFIIQ